MNNTFKELKQQSIDIKNNKSMIKFRNIFNKQNTKTNTTSKIFPSKEIDLLFEVQHSINRIYPKGCLVLTIEKSNTNEEYIKVNIEYTIPNVLFVFGQQYNEYKRIKAL